jgi:hypothetical protein
MDSGLPESKADIQHWVQSVSLYEIVCKLDKFRPAQLGFLLEALPKESFVSQLIAFALLHHKSPLVRECALHVLYFVAEDGSPLTDLARSAMVGVSQNDPSPAVRDAAKDCLD